MVVCSGGFGHWTFGGIELACSARVSWGVLRVNVLKCLNVVGGHWSELTGVVYFGGCMTKTSPNFI